MESLFSQLQQYSESGCYPLHMPGHKRKAFGELPQPIADLDITEIEGFDNLHQPGPLFAELQREAARLYGAEESFYLINGSTGGILSAVSAALPEGGHILMARNCHRSAYHAAYLRHLRISFLYPPVLETFDICGAITAEQVGEALEREPDIGAVLIVSPTYEGRIADIRAIAGIVHEKGIPLIVDEAHGAHLGLAEGFAENSCQAGADLVIHSVHKTLPAMTQTALLHVSGNRIDRERLKRFLQIYQSSSPSYVLMASIENVIRVINEKKDVLFGRLRADYSEMLERLKDCENLRFLPLEPGQDIGKLVLASAGNRFSGQWLYDLLRREYRLQLEMASASYCLAMFTAGDGPKAYRRMTDALLSLDRRIAAGEWKDRTRKEPAGPGSDFATRVTDFFRDTGEKEIPLTEAWNGEKESVPLEEAGGRYAGEFVHLYPPGIPLLVPGERIAERHCAQLREYLRMGLNVQGVEKAGASGGPILPSWEKPEDGDVSRSTIKVWKR